MGRRRKPRGKSPARKKNEARQKKFWGEMTADKMEDMMGDKTGVGGMQLYGYGGQGGKFKNEAEAKKFMRDLRKKESAAATQSAVGDMVQQYTGQTLPPPGQGGSPKGQPQGASPKGQPAMQDNTGAAAGTYMNRMRNQRGAAGKPGFGQFAPTPMQGGAGSPKGQPARRGGSPKGQPPPRTGGPTPSPTRAEMMRGSYERMPRRPRRPLPYERAAPQRRRAYNPATGLIE
tara:strand:+ start:735 stop:1427 length:693 start_codon:yes stop_codon:yes gene_type:complete